MKNFLNEYGEGFITAVVWCLVVLLFINLFLVQCKKSKPEPLKDEPNPLQVQIR